jgi:hypothetical protein
MLAARLRPPERQPITALLHVWGGGDQRLSTAPVPLWTVDVRSGDARQGMSDGISYIRTLRVSRYDRADAGEATGTCASRGKNDAVASTPAQGI